MLGAAAGALWLARLDARVQRYLAGPAIGTSRIMAAPKVLAAGAPVTRERLLSVLVRLGYVPTTVERTRPGDVRVVDGGVVVHQRSRRVPWDVATHRAHIAIANGRASRLLDLDAGTAIEVLEFAPEPLAVGGSRTVLEATAEAVPLICRDAVLAAEDRHFFRHPGVNPVAIARAAVINLRRGNVSQGGSTITQQLAKNAFLTPRRTYARKLREAVLALLLEARTSKQDILDRYLDSVYLGTDGGVPVHGLAQAARVHLGKPLADLDVGECATLAGMIHAPNRLAPRRHLEAATERRNQVLELMTTAGFLEAAEAMAAILRPLAPAPPRTRPVGALYVADHVQRELATLLPEDVRHSAGLTVYTSVDLDTQRDAEESVASTLDVLEGRYAHLARGTLQGALVALDAASGRIRALVGGRDYRASQLDRVARMRRQPGSTFKPFVYLTALDPARGPAGGTRTLASLVEDAPLSLQVNRRAWTPVNWDGEYHGVVTVADALAGSMNTATVRLALSVGLDEVVRTAREFGLGEDLPAVPALALGSGETSLLDLTAAYGALAAGGMYHPPRAVLAVTSAEGELLHADVPLARRVTTPGVAYLATYMLEQVIERGTGRAVRPAVEGAVAGKTGTTNRTRDAWFVGFTPDVVAGAWVGHDDGRRIGLGGSLAALPVWRDFVARVESRYPARTFPVPPEIVWHAIDPTTGLLATDACPQRRRMPFLRTAAPTRLCDRHAPLVEATRPEPSRRRGTGWEFGRWLRDLFR